MNDVAVLGKVASRGQRPDPHDHGFRRSRTSRAIGRLPADAPGRVTFHRYKLAFCGRKDQRIFPKLSGVRDCRQTAPAAGERETHVDGKRPDGSPMSGERDRSA